MQQDSPAVLVVTKRRFRNLIPTRNQVAQPDTSLRVGVTPLHVKVRVITVPQLSHGDDQSQ